MKKQQQTSPTSPAAAQPIPRTHALIAVPVVVPSRSLLATLVLILLLPVRIPLLTVALLLRGARVLLVGLARALGATVRGGARGVVWMLLLPVRIVVLLARLVALLAKGIARTIVFVVRLPFVVLRGLALGVGAVAVPTVAFAWGTVRWLAAGVAAVGRGVGVALAFLGRLLFRGLALAARGVFATFASMAIGIYVCLRWVLRIAFKLALLPLVAARFLVVALARGVRNGAALFLDAAIVVAVGLSEVARALVALARAGGVEAARASVAVTRMTREPRKALLFPLGALACIGMAELLLAGSFPFATCGLLLVGLWALLTLLPGTANVLAVLLVWTLTVGCGWRAEGLGASTPAWLDAFFYIAALAAVRAAYVVARVFVREVPPVPRAANQERAHRRASRAIGIVLAAQCVAFALWSAAEGRFQDAPLYGELLLVGAGMALAWVVRSGHYVRTAQFVLTLGALGALVVALAAQFSAFAAGRLVTAASLGAAVLLMLVAAALVVVVHTRLIDSEHGA